MKPNPHIPFEFDFSGGAAGERTAPPPARLAKAPAKVGVGTRKVRAAAVFKDVEVAPFTVVRDSREQLPYSFDGMTDSKTGKAVIVPTVVAGLKSGDYSILGLEDEVCCERKAHADAAGTFGQGRERFIRELERMAEMKFAAVIIECTLAELRNPEASDPCWHSRMSPASMEGSIIAWSVRYGVHFWLMGDRRSAEVRVFQTLDKYWRERERQAGR